MLINVEVPGIPAEALLYARKKYELNESLPMFVFEFKKGM